TYMESLNGTRGLDLEAARVTALRELKVHRVRDGRALVLAAFAERSMTDARPPAAQQGQAVAFADPDPWPDLVNGAALFARLETFAGRFLALPPGPDVLLPAFVL